MFKTYLKAENTIAILKDGEHFIEFAPLIIDGNYSGELPIKIHDDELMNLVSETYKAHGFPKAKEPLRSQMINHNRIQREASLKHIAGLICTARNLLDEFISDKGFDMDSLLTEELEDKLFEIESLENYFDDLLEE